MKGDYARARRYSFSFDIKSINKYLLDIKNAHCYKNTSWKTNRANNIFSGVFYDICLRCFLIELLILFPEGLRVKLTGVGKTKS